MTGNELLDQNQAFFTYAGVAISSLEADEIVQRLVRDHNLGISELKGQKLIRRDRGRRAVATLIQHVRGKTLLVAHHKKYALSCKFFEYIFEPVLATHNSIFYEAKFHRFISSLLFFWAAARDESAEQLLIDFAAFMRSLDPRRVPAFFGSRSIVLAADDPLSQIGTFCMIHRKKIAEDVCDLDDSPHGNWILDLTSSSLYSVLSHWGEKYHQIDVFCDESKPLRDNTLFDGLVNRSDRVYMRLGDNERLITFNLARPPQLVSSHQYAGVQIADVLASALRYSLEHRDDNEARQWLRDLEPSISGESVWPQKASVDLETPEGFANAILLRELVDRSVRRESLCDGIAEFIEATHRTYPEFEKSRAATKGLGE